MIQLKMKRKTTKQFIEESKKIHKDEFDYSKVEYINNQTKVIIICRIHSQFLQTPIHHIFRQQGCPACKGSKRKTTKEFIEEVKRIHQDIYDYSKVEYINNQTKVIISCPKHGAFSQSPSSHIYKKAGCPRCGTEKRMNKVRKSQKNFIKDARLIHKNTYNYSKIKYVSSFKKIEIICKKHGEFWQKPSYHLSGKGCRECYIEKLREQNTKRKSVKIFIAEARLVHENTYDYSKVKYINNKIKVEIICKVHGIFWQSPNHHLHGSGCTNCAFTGFNTNKPALLYYLKVNTDNYPLYKIGVTNYTVKKRFSNNDLDKITTLQTSIYPLGEDALREEKSILKKFKTYKYEGNKILDSGGNSELFTKDILALDENI